MSISKRAPWFLAKEKKDRSNFWKSRSSGYSASNYWLKDSIFEKKQSSFFNDGPTLEKESKYDHIQLAQYQRAIANFVRILTGRGDIQVKYNDGGNSYTDGKTITLSPNIKEKEFDTAVGLALHEASHILYTDFDRTNKYIDDTARNTGSRDSDEVDQRKLLLNLVEDLYIDAMTYRSAPGYRGYYSSLYQKYFGDKKIVEGLWSQDYAEPTWNNYLFHLINIRNPERNLQALPGLERMFKMLDLPSITRMSKFEDRITLSARLFEMINEYVDATKEYKQQLQGQLGQGGVSDEKSLNDLLEQMADQEDQDGNGGDDSNDQQNQTGNGGGSTDGKFTAGNGISIQEDIEATNALDLDKLSDKAKAQLEKILNQQKEFVKGQTKKGKLSKADQQKVDAWAEVDMEKKTVGSNSEFGVKGVPLYVINDISNSFIENLGRDYGIYSYVSPDAQSRINDAIGRGKILAKKLQLRNEERVLKTSRLDSGKIDKRLLHEIGFDNFDIFSKVNINAYKPSYIHISIDQSGSMNYGKFDSAMQFAAMFATASKYIKNIHLVVSLRSTFDGSSSRGRYNQENTPYLMYIFDSKKHNIQHIRSIFPKLRANNLTPEGLCFDGVMKDIIRKSSNTEAYFINICDGEPYLSYATSSGAFSYKGEKAQLHSRKQMQRMEQNGIKFITYFIGSKYDFEAVEKCYGKNSVLLQRSDEIGKITKTMNKKLLSV